MPFVEIKPGIYWIGVNDHTTDLFEGLWPIDEEGVSSIRIWLKTRR